jgi:hypothetical protein
VSTIALASESGIMDGMMMGQGMQGCMQMMRGMSGGGSQLPNQQWRRGGPKPSDEKPNPEPHVRSPGE